MTKATNVKIGVPDKDARNGKVTEVFILSLFLSLSLCLSLSLSLPVSPFRGILS